MHRSANACSKPFRPVIVPNDPTRQKLIGRRDPLGEGDASGRQRMEGATATADGHVDDRSATLRGELRARAGLWK